MKKLVVDFIETESVDKHIKGEEICSVFTELKSKYNNQYFYGKAKYSVPKKYRTLISSQFAEQISYLKAVVDLIDNYINLTKDKNKELLDGKKELNNEITDLIKDKMDFCQKIIKHREEPEDYRKSKTYLVNKEATQAIEIK